MTNISDQLVVVSKVKALIKPMRMSEEAVTRLSTIVDRTMREAAKLAAERGRKTIDALAISEAVSRTI